MRLFRGGYVRLFGGIVPRRGRALLRRPGATREEDGLRRPVHEIEAPHGGRIVVVARSRQRIEVSEAILPPHELCEVPHADDLASRRLDVAQREPGTPPVARVRTRRVKHAPMMQRHLARRQAYRHRLVLLDLHLELLPAGQQIVLLESVVVHDRSAAVRSRHEAHAPVRLVRLRERDPGAHFVGAVQTPVVEILVPGHVGSTARRLDEAGASPEQDIRTQDALHAVQDGRGAAQLVDETAREMRLAAQEAAAVLPRLFHLDHPRRVDGRLPFADDPDGKAEPILLVALRERSEADGATVTGIRAGRGSGHVHRGGDRAGRGDASVGRFVGHRTLVLNH